MPKTFELPDSIAFTVSTVKGVEFNLRLSVMDVPALVTLLTRGTRILAANATGAEGPTPEEKEAMVRKQIARYESGEYGDGIGVTVTPYDVHMRKFYSDWLVSKKVKRATADAMARKGVAQSFAESAPQHGLSLEQAKALFSGWNNKTQRMLAIANEPDETPIVIAPEDKPAESN
jgi:hypothetical protein